MARDTTYDHTSILNCKWPYWRTQCALQHGIRCYETIISGQLLRCRVVKPILQLMRNFDWKFCSIDRPLDCATICSAAASSPFTRSRGCRTDSSR